MPVNKITNNGKPFTKLSDVQKLMTENLQGKDIKRLYDIDFPINFGIDFADCTSKIFPESTVAKFVPTH